MSDSKRNTFTSGKVMPFAAMAAAASSLLRSRTPNTIVLGVLLILAVLVLLAIILAVRRPTAFTERT